MVNLRVQAGSTLSNVDIIKLHLYYEGPSTAEELAEEVSKWMRAKPSSERALSMYVLPVLSSKPLFVKQGDEYSIDLGKLPEHQVVKQIFEKERRYLSEKELKSLIAKELEIKVNSVAITPERVNGLKKLGKKWGLEHWRYVNDEAFEILKERKASFSEREIVRIVVEAGFTTEDNAIFDPEGDQRFKRDRKNWRAALDDERVEKVTKAYKSKSKTKLDKKLESDFVKSQKSKETQFRQQLRNADEKLKKVLIKKIVSEKLKDAPREPAVQIVPHDKLQDQFRDIFKDEQQEISAKIEFDKVVSYQRVEDAQRDTALTPRERHTINAFIERIATSDELIPLSTQQVSVSGPLSAPRIQHILYQRYAEYSMQRSIITDEYNRLLIELLKPKITDLVLNPGLQAGNLAVCLLNYLYDEMVGMYWAFGDHDTLQLVTHDNEKLNLDARDTALIESVKENFVLNRNDLLYNFIEYNFCGIDFDPVLTQAAKIIARLSGYDNVFVVCKDFLSELPEVFNQQPNPENDIDLVFQVILGNMTFKNDQNIVANYLDQALRIVAADGRIGFFLRWDFMKLLDGHQFLTMIQDRHYFETVVKLAGVPGESDLAAVIIKPRDFEGAPPIRFSTIAASTEINKVQNQLKSDKGGDLVKLIPQDAYSMLFD